MSNFRHHLPILIEKAGGEEWLTKKQQKRYRWERIAKMLWQFGNMCVKSFMMAM